MIELNGITKEYQMGSQIVHALRGVDLVIDDGEFWRRVAIARRFPQTSRRW